MIDTEFLKVSDGTGDAALATVQTARSIGATLLDVDTLAKYPAKYIVTTGTLDAAGFMTAATMTVMRAHTTGSDIIIDGFEPGYADIGNTVGQKVVIKPVTSHTDKVIAALDTLDAEVRTRSSESLVDYIVSGGVWTLISGFNASMTALVGYQDGYRGTVAALTSRTFTASKDTYVDVLRTTGITSVTMTLVYTEVVNGAASPALAANSIRLAKVITSGAAVTSIVQNGADTIGNIIYPINTPTSTKNLQNPIKFSAYSGAGSSLSPAAFTKVGFNTKEYDTGNNYDNVTNSRFTVPAGNNGYYSFSAAMQITGNGGEAYAIALYKNSTEYKRGGKITIGAGTTTNQFTVSPPPMYLVAGDYIEVWGYNSSGGAKSVSAGQQLTYFGGYLVSRV